MTPRGAAPLIDMRLAGQRPSRDVWVTYGDFREPDWHRWAETCGAPEILVRPGDPIDRLDFRCLVELRVVLFFGDWNERVGQLYERLQEYALEIVVMSPCFDSDIGWWWLKRYGQVEFNQRHYVAQFEAAQERCRAASGQKGEAGRLAYAAAQAEELRVLAEAPWLR